MQQSAHDSLKRALFSGAASRKSRKASTKARDNSDDEDEEKQSSYLVYKGKVNLPHRPIRMRYLAYSNQRLLLYGKYGYQEMARGQEPEVYALENTFDQIQVCDCVQTSDLLLYTVSRGRNSAVLACYDEAMAPQAIVSVSYPLGCLSSLATDSSCTYLYGTNEELNCVLRFTTHDLSLSNAERFGALWRPFDSCTSQVFNRKDGTQVQFLFVSNLDAGIFVFDLGTMEVVAECGSDLSPGAKYIAYDPKRLLLFVSSSHDRLLRCYRMELPPEGSTPPVLHMVGDFLVVKRKYSLRSSGPQGVMWDPSTEHLDVISWSLENYLFRSKLFRVNF